MASRAWKGYVRAKLPDGSYEPESYAFGNGGHLSGPLVDPTIDKMAFLDVARVAARALARTKYFPATDPNKTRLLIMVYWGTTTGTKEAGGSIEYQDAQSTQAVAPPPPPPPPHGGPAMVSHAGNTQTIDDSTLEQAMIANRQQDLADSRNAMLLGYDSELVSTSGLENTALRGTRSALLDDLEENRYFVILMAYDFQMMWKEKKHKLLWETRISLRQRGSDFGKDLPSMMQYASHFFGEETDGLVRNPVPQGRVEVGEPKVIETPEK